MEFVGLFMRPLLHFLALLVHKIVELLEKSDGIEVFYQLGFLKVGPGYG
jgi:hypothetical protein